MTLMETVEIERHARKSSQTSNGRSENRKNSSRKSTSARKKWKQSEDPGEIDQDNIAADLRENFPVIRENFNVLSNIGEGTFSKVYLAQLKACTDEIVAIKHIVPTSAPSRVKNELSCLQKLGGKHNVIGVKTTLRNNDHIAFILPYFKHDKFQFCGFDQHTSMLYTDNFNLLLMESDREKLITPRGLTTNEIKDYMRNLFLALEHVHHYNIIHRDVKPSNFLHSRESKRYLLVDFGLAMQAPGTHGILSDEKMSTSVNTRTRGNSKERQNSSRSNSTEAMKNALKNSLARGEKCAGKSTKQHSESNLKTDVLCKTGHQPGHSPNAVCSFCCSRSGQVAPRAGTPGFRSPEVLMKLPNQTTAVDIWSAGIILLSFLSGRYPFFKAKDDLSSLAQIITIFGSKEAAKAGSLMGKDLTCSPTVTAFELKSLCERLRQKNCTCQKLTRHKRKYKARDVASKRAKIDDNHEFAYEELNEIEFSQERVNVFDPNSCEQFKGNRDVTTKVQGLRRSPRKRQGLRLNDKLENLSTPFGYKTIEHSEECAIQDKGHGSLEKSCSQRSCLGDCFCIPDAAYDLLSKCLKLDPAQRISASAALYHHFLTS